MSGEALAALAVNVILLAAIVWLAWRLARRRGNGKVSANQCRMALLLLLIPANAIRTELPDRLEILRLTWANHYRWEGQAMLAVAAVCAGWLALRFARQLARVAAAILLILSPFTLLTFGLGIRETLDAHAALYRDKPLAPRLPAAAGGPRVLWIIFDEMDYRLAFVDRDPTLQLPEFDRFRAIALTADHAYPPARETLISMPALICGRAVRWVAPQGPDNLLITFPDEPQAVRWDRVPNVFSAARHLGFNTAIVGWYLPYCRVLNGSLTDCWWWAMGTREGVEGADFWQIARSQALGLFETGALSPFGQSQAVQRRVRHYLELLARAKKAAADPTLGLVLMHFPVPHPPHPYDRRTKTFTLANSRVRGYIDSLALADRTLGEVRRAMEEAGTWRSTTVLVSADHSYRSSELLDGKVDYRVPFLLKLAAQEDGLQWNRRFQTVLTHDLLLAVLSGALQDPAQAWNWMEQHSAAQTSHSGLGAPAVR